MTDKSVLFELKLTPNIRGGTAINPSSPDTSLRRHDQETGRKLANQYAEEAMLKLVSIMRVTTDENVALRTCKMIMDRAWGQTKALTEEEKKGADAGSILDILASVSITQTQIENEARGHVQRQAIEGQATTVLDGEDLLEEIERLERGE